MRRKQRDIQVERLEFEIRNLRSQIDRMRQEPYADIPTLGCGNNPCYVASPRGMATQGSCNCDDRRLAMALQYYRRRCEFLQATIQEMRDGRPEENLRRTAEYFIKDSSLPLPKE